MLQITSTSNCIIVKGINNALYPSDGELTFPFNAITVVTDDSGIATFKNQTNDVIFSGLIEDITIDGQKVTKETIGEKFASVANKSTGGGEGGGGMTPEEKQELKNLRADMENALGDISALEYDKADKTELEKYETIEAHNADKDTLQSNIDKKQDKLVSGTNIKTINGESVVGSGDISIRTNNDFPTNWKVNGTMKELIDSIVADTTVVQGKSYMKTVNLTDLPQGMSAAEVIIDVLHWNGTKKVLYFTMTSADTAPYHWEYTSVNGKEGVWRGFVPETTLTDGYMTQTETENYVDNAKQELQGKIDANGAKIASVEQKVDGIDLTPLATKESLETAKNDLQSQIFDCVNDAEYVKEDRKIYLKHDSMTIAEIDTTDFIKDGMVENVVVEDGYLVITFNTDSGKEDIKISIDKIFNAENYYTKNEVDGKLYVKLDASVFNEFKNTVYTKGEADEKFITEHQDISNLATKEEVNAKQNKLTGKYSNVQSSSTTGGTAGENAYLSYTNQNFDGTEKTTKYLNFATINGKNIVDIVDSMPYSAKTKLNLATVEQLDNYQEKGDYATKEELGELENKIPSTDNFATKEDLDKKQNKGDYAYNSQVVKTSGGIYFAVRENDGSKFFKIYDRDHSKYVQDLSDIPSGATIYDMGTGYNENRIESESWTAEQESIGRFIVYNYTSITISYQNFNVLQLKHVRSDVWADASNTPLLGTTDALIKTWNLETFEAMSSNPVLTKTGYVYDEVRSIGKAVMLEQDYAKSLVTKDKLDAKQDKLIAGENITIEGNVISATGGGGEAVDAYTKTESDEKYATKQEVNQNYVQKEGEYVKSVTADGGAINFEKGNGTPDVVNFKTVGGQSIIGMDDIKIPEEVFVKNGTSIVYGDAECDVSGNYNMAVGHNADANGSYNFVMGSNSSTTGQFSFVFGDGVKNSYANCFLAGNVKGNRSFNVIIGNSIQSRNEYATVFGRNNYHKKSYTDPNKPTTFGEKDNILFVVGNGYDVGSINNYHDAIRIMQNGDIFIPDTNDTTDTSELAYSTYPMLKLQDYLHRQWKGTQAEYDALGTYDDNTVYYILED